MNRRYGMSADATLKAAQSLYENKLISYPRTDSRYLGNDMKSQVPGILADLKPLKPDEIGKLELAGPRLHRADHQRRQGERSPRDHPDRQAAGRAGAGGTEGLRRRRHATDRRLLPRLRQGSDDRQRDLQRSAVPGQGRARARSRLDRPLSPQGRRQEGGGDQELPEFRPGESGPHEPFVRRGETTPPKPYTEGSLLGAMETAGKLVEEEQLKEALKERGLGTPATRASIIETLLDRGYITRDKKSLAATDLGRYLVAIVQDRSLKSPELTGDWEAKLRQIERGRLDPREFMAEIVRYTGDVIRSDDAAAVDPARLGDCPRCGRPVIEGKRGYGCSGWRDGCPFVLWREYRGHPLTEDQVRELLQRRVLLRPLTIDGSGEVILHLTDIGRPDGDPGPDRRPAEAGARPEGPRQGGRTSRRALGSPARAPRRTARARAGGRHSGDTRDLSRAAPDDEEAAEAAPRPREAGGGLRSRRTGPLPVVRLRRRRAAEVVRMQRLEAGLQVRDLEDDRRQGDRSPHGPVAAQERSEPAAQRLPIEGRQPLRRSTEAGRGRGPLRLRRQEPPQPPRSPDS